MAKAESIEAYDIKDADWDSSIKNVPSSKDGEFAASGTNAVVADLSALSFTETSRTPMDGFTARDQSHFPTKNGGKTS
jgi:hypothetical protein